MKFVRIDTTYVGYLNQIDSRVQYTDPALKKDNKPFFGALFHRGATEYFVPLSSPKKKHINMPNRRDFHKILDNDGNLLAIFSFNNMIPVVPALYQRIDFKTDKDGNLLTKEYLFCTKNIGVITRKAINLYYRYKKGILTPEESLRTCDFAALEKGMQDYLANLSTSQQKTTVSNQPAVASVANGQKPASAPISSQLKSMILNFPSQENDKGDSATAVSTKDNVND